jgi:hypothetical protein
LRPSARATRVADSPPYPCDPFSVRRRVPSDVGGAPEHGLGPDPAGRARGRRAQQLDRVASPPSPPPPSRPGAPAKRDRGPRAGRRARPANARRRHPGEYACRRGPPASQRGRDAPVDHVHQPARQVTRPRRGSRPALTLRPAETPARPARSPAGAGAVPRQRRSRPRNPSARRRFSTKAVLHVDAIDLRATGTDEQGNGPYDLGPDQGRPPTDCRAPTVPDHSRASRRPGHHQCPAGHSSSSALHGSEHCGRQTPRLLRSGESRSGEQRDGHPPGDGPPLSAPPR